MHIDHGTHVKLDIFRVNSSITVQYSLRRIAQTAFRSCIINNMATTTVIPSEVRPVDILSEQEESFAALVAAGFGYRAAALKAGWDKDYGWDKAQVPRIKARIAGLVLDPVERVRAGIDADLLMMRRRAAAGDMDAEERANMELRLKLLMSHAKLRGWIVDRKQIDKRSVDLSLVGSAELQEHLSGVLDTLEPGARREIDQRLAIVKKRRKAAQRAKGKTVTVDVDATEEEDE